MATVEQIERDIAALEEALSGIAVELGSAYTTYLTTLGQVMRQHLILASYHLCTQGYPEPFLNLSFSQRQELQQALRKLSQNAAEQLLAPIKTDVAPYPSNPKSLVQWQQNLEGTIANTLKTVSRDTNRLLQQSGILPNKLLEPLLEAAAKAEASADGIAGPPNLLNLLIESDNQDLQDATVTHIIAVHMRLSEIEFADAAVRAGRNQIRNLLFRVKSLGQEYQKKQREWAVAQAEAAWRVSWFEE